MENLKQRQKSILAERPRVHSKNRYDNMSSFNEELAGSLATQSLDVKGENTVSEESDKGVGENRSESI